MGALTIDNRGGWNLEPLFSVPLIRGKFSARDLKTPPLRSPATEGIPRIHRHGVSGLSARSKDQQQRFVHDIECKVVGPMPTQFFIDEILPNPPNRELELKEYGIDLCEINFPSVPDSPGK